MKKKLLLTLIFLAISVGNIIAQTQLITNGNFSSGSTGWVTSNNWHITTTHSCYYSSTGYAYAGDASGNAVANESGDLMQSFTIPSSATSVTFSFYTSKNTDETTTTTVYDYVNVFLLNSSGIQLMQFSPTNINNLYSGYPVTNCDGYSYKSFSIPSSYFGQTVYVDFSVCTDGGPKNSMFRIDDVSVMATVPLCTGVTQVTTQPQSQSVCSGSSATFTVAGNGDAPFTYTWHNGSGTVVGSNSPSYSTSTAGNYSCVISNCSGSSVTSYTATLTVTPSPTTPIISATGGTSFCQGGSTTLQVTNTSSCSGCSYTWYPSGSGTSINVTSAGTYYCTSSNSCPGTSQQSNSIPITVTPSPVTPVIAAQGGITSFCQGTGSATLQVTNSGSCAGCTYTWYPSGSGTSINVTNANTYYCTSSNSCPGTSPQSNSIQITVNTTPVTSFTYNGSGCNWNFTDNSTGSPSSWNWNFGDPASGANNTSILQNPQHLFSSAATYNVSLQATNLCGSNSTNHYIIATGIGEYNLPNIENISVSPNPISNSALINFTIIKKINVSISLYNILGEKVSSISETEYSPGDYSITFNKTENLTAGTYFIKFDTNNSSEKTKIVLN